MEMRSRRTDVVSEGVLGEANVEPTILGKYNDFSARKMREGAMKVLPWWCLVRDQSRK